MHTRVFQQRALWDKNSSQHFPSTRGDGAWFDLSDPSDRTDPLRCLTGFSLTTRAESFDTRAMSQRSPSIRTEESFRRGFSVCTDEGHRTLNDGRHDSRRVVPEDAGCSFPTRAIPSHPILSSHRPFSSSPPKNRHITIDNLPSHSETSLSNGITRHHPGPGNSSLRVYHQLAAFLFQL